MEWFSLGRLNLQAVFFAESHKNIVIGLCQIIHNTIDIGFGIFGAVDVYVFVGRNVHRIGDAKVIPEKLVQGGVFVNPQYLPDGQDSIAVGRSHNKVVLRDKHIFRSQLWQGFQLFFSL